MKKIMAGALALLFTAAGCFARDYKVGDVLRDSAYSSYMFFDTGLSSEAFVAGVLPDGETGFYIVEIMTMFSPGGSKSAVGVHSTFTRYRVREGDFIQIWKLGKYGIGTDRGKLEVKSVGDNHIELEEVK